MSVYEFEVARNLSGVEGTIEGYFAPEGYNPFQIWHATMLGRAVDCLENAIKNGINIRSQTLIPIVEEEFGHGQGLKVDIPVFNLFVPGVVTFGTDQYEISAQTHLGVIVRELATEKEKYVAPLCKVPDGMSNLDFRENSPFRQLFLKYGSVTVKGTTCAISVDEKVPHLPDIYDYEPSERPEL